MADALIATPDASQDRWALGCEQSSEAFDDLVAGWRRQRLVLAEALTDLADKAQVAGAAYVDVEHGARQSLGGATR